jgi:hypothetical protein
MPAGPVAKIRPAGALAGIFAKMFEFQTLKFLRRISLMGYKGL